MDDCGLTALTAALDFEGGSKLPPDEAAARRIELISLLVQRGADVNQNLICEGSALHVAAFRSPPEVVAHLLEPGGAWRAAFGKAV